MIINHAKTNTIAAWTQAQLDAQIALGNFAPGTLLADIVLPTDWNAAHTITVTAPSVLGKITAGSGVVVELGISGTAGNVLLTDGSGASLTGITAGQVGLGNVDNTSNATERAATATLTNKIITNRIVTATTTATLTVNADTTDIAILTAQSGALSIAAPTGTPVNGQPLMIRITAAAAETFSWNAIFRARSDQALSATATAGKDMSFGFEYNTTAVKWQLMGIVVAA